MTYFCTSLQFTFRVYTILDSTVSSTNFVLIYCFLDMLTNGEPSKYHCGTPQVTFLLSYFPFTPTLYLLTNYLFMLELSKLCNDCLASFKVFGKSFCQRHSGYPSKLCHIYPSSTTVENSKRPVRQNVTVKKYFTLQNTFHLSRYSLILMCLTSEILCCDWGTNVPSEKNKIGVNQLYLTTNYWQSLQILMLLTDLQVEWLVELSQK